MLTMLGHRQTQGRPWMVTNKGSVSMSDRTYRKTDSKIRGANMGPTWVLSAPDGPRVGPMNLAHGEDLANSRSREICVWNCPIGT